VGTNVGALLRAGISVCSHSRGPDLSRQNQQPTKDGEDTTQEKEGFDPRSLERSGQRVAWGKKSWRDEER